MTKSTDLLSLLCVLWAASLQHTRPSQHKTLGHHWAKIGPVCTHFGPMLACCFVLATVSQAWCGG